MRRNKQRALPIQISIRKHHEQGISSLNPASPQGTLSLISCPIILLNNGAKSTIDEITVRDPGCKLDSGPRW